MDTPHRRRRRNEQVSAGESHQGRRWRRAEVELTLHPPLFGRQVQTLPSLALPLYRSPPCYVPLDLFLCCSFTICYDPFLCPPVFSSFPAMPRPSFIRLKSHETHTTSCQNIHPPRPRMRRQSKRKDVLRLSKMTVLTSPPPDRTEGEIARDASSRDSSPLGRPSRRGGSRAVLVALGRFGVSQRSLDAVSRPDQKKEPGQLDPRSHLRELD